MSEGRPRIGDLLVDLGFIDEAQLEAALQRQREVGDRLGKILVESAVITEDRLVHALARQLGIDTCDPVVTPIHPRVLELLPPSTCFRHRVLALARKREGDGEVIYVAMADPLDTTAMEAVRQRVGANVRLHWMLAGETEMELALEKHLGARPGPEGAAEEAAGPASTYQGVPVVQGLPLGRDLPPRRASSASGAPAAAPSPPAPPPSAPPPAPARASDPFAPLPPGAELSATGSIDAAFEGAFAEPPEEELPAEAFESVDPFEEPDDPAPVASPAPATPDLQETPHLPTADLEVLPDDDAPEEDELEPIPLERFAERAPAAEAAAPEPGIETLEGDAIEALPDDSSEEPDAVSEPFAMAPPSSPFDSEGLPPLGPFPSEPLGAGRAVGADAPDRASGSEAPPGPPPAQPGPPTWGDLLGGTPDPARPPSPSLDAVLPPLDDEAPTPRPAVEPEPEPEPEPTDDVAPSPARSPAPGAEPASDGAVPPEPKSRAAPPGDGASLQGAPETSPVDDDVGIEFEPLEVVSDADLAAAEGGAPAFDESATRELAGTSDPTEAQRTAPLEPWDAAESRPEGQPGAEVASPEPDAFGDDRTEPPEVPASEPPPALDGGHGVAAFEGAGEPSDLEVDPGRAAAPGAGLDGPEVPAEAVPEVASDPAARGLEIEEGSEAPPEPESAERPGPGGGEAGDLTEDFDREATRSAEKAEGSEDGSAIRSGAASPAPGPEGPGEVGSPPSEKSPEAAAEAPAGGDAEAPEPARPAVEAGSLGAQLDRFVAGGADGETAAWWTRVMLHAMRDAGLLSEERLQRATEAVRADEED